MKKNIKSEVAKRINSLMQGFNDTANDVLRKHGFSENVDEFLQNANETELIWFWSHFAPIRKDKNGDYYLGDYEYQ